MDVTIGRDLMGVEVGASPAERGVGSIVSPLAPLKSGGRRGRAAPLDVPSSALAVVGLNDQCALAVHGADRCRD